MRDLRIGIVDRSELVMAGLTQILAVHPASSFSVVPAEPLDGQWPDVILYGVDQVGAEGDWRYDHDLHLLLHTATSTVILTYWDQAGPALTSGLRCGAHGAVSIRLGVDQLIDQIEGIVESRGPVEMRPADGPCPEVARFHLTVREVDVLTLITAGLTNQEIADQLFLSINSVKTYVRTAYRKIGAERRAHAVVWGERYGLRSPPAVETSERQLGCALRHPRREELATARDRSVDPQDCVPLLA